MRGIATKRISTATVRERPKKTTKGSTDEGTKGKREVQRAKIEVQSRAVSIFALLTSDLVEGVGRVIRPAASRAPGFTPGGRT